MTAQASRLISLRIPAGDYSKLQRDAAALGLKPAVLARVLIRASLNAPSAAPRRHSRRQVAAALDRIDRRIATGGVPAVDPVALIKRAREEREQQRASLLFGPADVE
jgi:hypothetical protein